MINLLILLCSMCLQFGAVGYGDIAPNYQYLIDDCQSFLSTGNSWMQTYSRVPDEYWYAFDKGDGTYLLMFPREYAEPNYSSSETVNSLIDNYGLNVTFIQYVQITYNNGRYSYVWGSPYTINIYYYTEDNTLYPELLYIGRESFYYNGEYQVDLHISDDVTVPVLLSQLGSMSGGGHSSGGSPLESLGGLSWASMNGHSSGGAVAPSPHSSSTHYNITIQAPSNDDSKTDNLLYMLGNKLADITENTSAISSALGGVMYNIIEGASTIFNGISALNDNIINFASYITSVPTSQDISEALDECENIGSLRDLSESINIWNELGLTQVNSAPSYTFNFAGTMFDSMGNFTLNFNFLDSTKNLWQPLFIALLYFNLLITILTGLPDLIQGRGET